LDLAAGEGGGERVDERLGRAAGEHAQILRHGGERQCNQQKPQPHASFPFLAARSRSFANCIGGTGSPYRKPCTSSQPWRLRKWSFASVSTPSAMTFTCSAWPSELMACASTPSSASDPERMSRTNE